MDPEQAICQRIAQHLDRVDGFAPLRRRGVARERAVETRHQRGDLRFSAAGCADQVQRGTHRSVSFPTLHEREEREGGQCACHIGRKNTQCGGEGAEVVLP